ncbi:MULTISPECIES: peroxiredoxin family protein [Candidatus Ichthyocystis]|uniref:peroxiredoxin family protein n=1 Tax=Candidatus Ichthyocystis TaxID=2929841 RepID=UPI000B867666|nr:MULTISPECIES: TlpA disulfide reductase family protein [Ichthyocystis]
MNTAFFFKRLLIIVSISAVVVMSVVALSVTRVSLTELPIAHEHDRIVLVNFWSISCPTCVSELPLIKKVWSDFHNKGFNVVGVSMWYDGRDEFNKFSSRNKQLFPYPVLIDSDKKIQQRFGGIYATPTSFLVNVADGSIRKRYLGKIDPTELYRDINNALPSKFNQVVSY